MAKQSKGIEREEVEAHIKSVDEKTPSPTLRATKVLEHIKKGDFTNWDIVCFCAEYLAMTCLELPWLKEYVRPAVRIIYNAHYYMPDESYVNEELLRR